MKYALWCGLWLAAAPVSQAGIIFLNNVNAGTPLSINSLTGLPTTGDLMDGMIITATFSNGQTQTCVWAATGAGAGGCAGGAAANGSFSLNVSGDTETNPFQLTNLSTTALLLSLTLNAAPANAVFDIITAPGLTPGSGFGQAVSGFTPTGAPNGLGTYSNIVNLGTDPAQGDLYTQLVIEFGALGLAPGIVGTFVADTDSISPAVSGVPEPVTYVLCGISLVTMGLFRRLQLHDQEPGGKA
ncbi:MAG: hypothetical protein K2X03_26250 [Bryobacteraceae bacterium]|nr:hypothetical protein [Bryobacteraceae bacterium]